MLTIYVLLVITVKQVQTLNMHIDAQEGTTQIQQANQHAKLVQMDISAMKLQFNL